MSPEQEQITALILKYLSGEITVEEQVQLDTWLNANVENRALMEEFRNEAAVRQELEDIYHTKSRIWQQLQEYTVTNVRSVRNYRRIALYAASVCLLVVGASVYLVNRWRTPIPIHVAATRKERVDIPSPTTGRAYVTLNNGKRVYIDSLQTGANIVPGGNLAQKLSPDKIEYANNSRAAAPELNTITVPRGSKPLLIALPDGSQVWVNVASTISFQVPFAGKERLVNVSGEAYFDVAAAATQPFIVKSKGQEIKVLGTAFNIKSYEDESTIRTTLVKGKIQISQNKSGTMKTLTAGQQAISPPDGPLLINQDADMEEALAWKANVFQFRNEDLKSIMQQLGRWYDVEVVYQGSVPNRFFTVKISRDKSLTAVLKIMELYGISFRLEGKKLTVLP
ncbi:FecR family protein [Chitinophaga sp. RAB17]|uniref:FecR family protein n=1 Tax=Chitinophaga sp. RAB17 TaxID=3233049 RepID=UPI003F92893C